MYYANGFDTKKSGLEKLTAISTYCVDANSYIKLYVSTDGGKTFSEEKAASGYIYDASKGYKIDDAGYYTFMLANPVELNCNKYVVAIEVQNTNTAVTNIIPIEGTGYEAYSSNAVVENGSYVGYNFDNLKSNITKANNYSSNTCIKAFTENTTVDKATLQSLYNANKDKTQGNYTTATWTTVINALSNAKTIIDKTSATTTEIDSAYTALSSAINGLADKSALQGLYNSNKNKVQGNYTITTWTTLTSALANAKTIIDKTDATQTEIDAAYSVLNTAINGLISETSSISTGGSSGGGGGGTGSAATTATTATTTNSSNDVDVNTSNSNANISAQVSNLINGQVKSTETLKTSSGNSISCTNVVTANNENLKVLTTGNLSSQTASVGDTISVNADGNSEVYVYIEAINKYLPITSQKDGDTIKFNIASNTTYVVAPNILPAVTAGWNKVDTSWYSINTDGSLKTGWLKDTDNSWYNLSSTGKMNIGWFKDTDNSWYNLSNTGRMNTGWFKDTDGQWYFLKNNGTMASNENINGYYLGANGAWIS